MKDLGKASYILGIKLLGDQNNKTLALSETAYTDQILARFSMENSNTSLLTFRHGITLSMDQLPKTPKAKRKRYDKFLMQQPWEVSCMSHYILDQIFILQQRWSVDTDLNLILTLDYSQAYN